MANPPGEFMVENSSSVVSSDEDEIHCAKKLSKKTPVTRSSKKSHLGGSRRPPLVSVGNRELRDLSKFVKGSIKMDLLKENSRAKKKNKKEAKKADSISSNVENKGDKDFSSDFTSDGESIEKDDICYDAKPLQVIEAGALMEKSVFEGVAPSVGLKDSSMAEIGLERSAGGGDMNEFGSVGLKDLLMAEIGLERSESESAMLQSRVNEFPNFSSTNLDVLVGGMGTVDDKVNTDLKEKEFEDVDFYKEKEEDCKLSEMEFNRFLREDTDVRELPDRSSVSAHGNPDMLCDKGSENGAGSRNILQKLISLDRSCEESNSEFDRSKDCVDSFKENRIPELGSTLDSSSLPHPSLNSSSPDVLIPGVSNRALRAPTQQNGVVMFNVSTIKDIGSVEVRDGTLVLSFNRNDHDFLVGRMGLALVGKFSHAIPSPAHIDKALRNIKVTGSLSWYFLNARHILIKLTHDVDYVKLIKGAHELPIWFVNGCPMHVFKWTPGFNPSFETSIFAIWITLPGLPLHLFDHNALFKIGSIFGKPIQIESATANRTRVSFARLYVEIDLTKTYPTSIVLNLDGHEMHQRVVFDKMPLYCVECKHLGHAKETCYAVGNVQVPRRPSNARQAPAHPNHARLHLKDKGKGIVDQHVGRHSGTSFRGSSSRENGNVSDGWQQVDRRKRKPNFHAVAKNVSDSGSHFRVLSEDGIPPDSSQQEIPSKNVQHDSTKNQKSVDNGKMADVAFLENVDRQQLHLDNDVTLESATQTGSSGHSKADIQSGKGDRVGNINVMHSLGSADSSSERREILGSVSDEQNTADARVIFDSKSIEGEQNVRNNVKEAKGKSVGLNERREFFVGSVALMSDRERNIAAAVSHKRDGGELSPSRMAVEDGRVRSRARVFDGVGGSKNFDKSRLNHLQSSSNRDSNLNVDCHGVELNNNAIEAAVSNDPHIEANFSPMHTSPIILIWNARGLGSKAKCGYLHNLIKLHRLSIVVIIEPKVRFDSDFFSRRFGLTLVASNVSNHIWIFCARDFTVAVDLDFNQLLHVRVDSPLLSRTVFLSLVYGRHSREDRFELWDHLRDIALGIEGRPWLVGGDFNIFLTDDEVENGVSDHHCEMMDFGDAISDCQLLDPGFDGAWFTWERPSTGLRERLDRVLLGQFWMSVFAITRVTHLSRHTSDHAPLLASYDSSPTPDARVELSRCVAEYVLRTRREEDFWKQKAAVQWVIEGERNSRFFQGWVKQRRCKSRIHSIEDDGRVIEDDDGIWALTAGFFQRLLTSDIDQLGDPDFSCLHGIPTDMDTDGLCRTPDIDEIRSAIFGISGDSVSGPDGFTSLFFQHCWDIVSSDVVGAVVDFFAGAHMPRSFTATTIVLLQKKERPSGFVKGRFFSDNVLLAQEMIGDLHISRDIPNVALKLDMVKAYDRVQWSFLLAVLRHMGFPDQWVDMISRCIKDCWFSVLVNGVPAGFFPSSRGLR
ncbi:hypothetical protein C2S52_014123 [Perilla frutescens var. hirtella]|nr:hypothetical protein C2S52_014123 [Perilla frutescens var. hirtella]